MNKDEEKYWIPLAATGDRKAIDFVLEENAGFAVIIARSYLGDEGWCDLDDLVQQARLGQLEAIHTWDPEGGAGFCSWSLWHMQGSIREFLRFRGAICGSSAMQAIWERAEKTANAHYVATGETLSLGDSLQAMGKCRETIKRMDRARARVLSLDAPKYSDGTSRVGSRIGEHVSDESIPHPLDRMSAEAVTAAVPRILKHLKPRDRQIIIKRYGLGDEEPKTNQEIADEISASTRRSFSKQRVSQIEHRALATLRRAALRDPNLREAVYDPEPEDRKEVI